MNKHIAVAFTLAATVTAGLPAQAESRAVTVEDLLSQKNEIESLERTVQKLKLQLEQKELENKIENVGKEQENPDGELDSTSMYPGMPEFLNPMATTGPSTEDEERRRQERLDAALDNAVVSSVFRDTAKEMRATLTLPSGNLPIRVGRKVGNWEIKDIRLNGVLVEHVSNGEEKLIPTATEAAGA